MLKHIWADTENFQKGGVDAMYLPCLNRAADPKIIQNDIWRCHKCTTKTGIHPMNLLNSLLNMQSVLLTMLFVHLRDGSRKFSNGGGAIKVRTVFAQKRRIGSPNGKNYKFCLKCSTKGGGISNLRNPSLRIRHCIIRHAHFRLSVKNEFIPLSLVLN